MKSRKLKIIKICIVCCIATGIIYPAFSRYFSPPPPPAQYIGQELSDIVGAWVSEADIKWKLIFNSNGKCYNYYDNILRSTTDYSISNTTPQCGENVLVDENKKTSYLQLIDNVKNTHVCYEINGITGVLSLTTVGTSDLFILTRQ